MKLVQPSLQDLPNISNEIIPLTILEQWSASNKTLVTHRNILDPFRLPGFLVCSDSVGLSKMSGEHNLFEILRLIEEPKEVLNCNLNEIGGLPIGVWCADNTTTFISSNVEVNEVVNCVGNALNQINELTVKIGICIHRGEYYKFGNSFFGDDFELCSLLAESHTSASELIITADSLNTSNLQLPYNLRTDLKYSQKVYSIDVKNIPPRPIQFSNANYSSAFDKDFSLLLKNQEVAYLENRMTKNHFICFVHINNHQKFHLLLDKYLQRVNNIKALQSISMKFNLKEIKGDGQIAIYISDDFKAITAFSNELLNKNAELKSEVNVGITFGDFLVFALENARFEIAGAPVNIAAKLAEDTVEKNMIYMHESVPNLATEKSTNSVNFSINISNVEIKGKKLFLT